MIYAQNEMKRIKITKESYKYYDVSIDLLVRMGISQK